MPQTHLRLILTPHGLLTLEVEEGASALDPAVAQRLGKAFARGLGHGLLQLGAGEVGSDLPPELGFWRELGARYVTAVCARPEVQATRLKVAGAIPPPPDLVELAQAAPVMTGAEYLTVDALAEGKRIARLTSQVTMGRSGEAPSPAPRRQEAACGDPGRAGSDCEQIQHCAPGTPSPA